MFERWMLVTLGQETGGIAVSLMVATLVFTLGACVGLVIGGMLGQAKRG